ncbi:uncharacterized protein YtfP isoform X2 [Juglans microcarpa x Juglans regia]|uniref:uncharacterized protein YtfP isoform X2 n=1 Tax=Juglans microcarpa x Juglans regia TaxID=2249226 RepID=UPI001B7E8A2B|nr:uncharacterized protein YtfP isoform X2 [Juglans microcarpa x Juglans regia]
MSFTLARFIFLFAGISSRAAGTTGSCGSFLSFSGRRKFAATSIPLATKSSEELLVVVGGGAAGVFGAIRAKTLAPNLNVLVIEKGKPLSKVKISGGGRCNVTNGHCADNLIEDDGRVFPVSNSSSSIIDCLMSQATKIGVSLQTGKVVTTASASGLGKFLLKIEKRTIDYVEYVEADYLLIASGSSPQGYRLVAQLNHSIVDPVPSLFTFKIEDPKLAELAGVTFPKVKAKLKLENVRRNIPQLTQVGPMLVTHWGLSGPVVLRLSAWGARDLFSLGYEGILIVDFTPDLNMEDVKSILSQHKLQFVKQKVLNSCPSEFGLVKRFWKYILDRESLVEDMLWASISNNSLNSVASLLKHCSFRVTGKGQFKDEFVTAGGVPLSEISLNTMESKIQSHLYFAGEVLNVDGITGGYNFQNAWSGGYIAGTSIGELARGTALEERVL